MIDHNRPGRGGHPSISALAAALVALACVSAATTSFAAAPTKEQAKCLLAVNKAAASISRAEGKLIASCVKDAALGRLVEPSIDACLAADSQSKVGNATARGVSRIAGTCIEAPDYGTTDLTGATVANAVPGVRTALFHKLFGNSLGSTIATRDGDPAAYACQGALVQALDRCWTARMKEYASCVPETFTLADPGVTDMGNCRSSDPRGKVQAACVDNIQKALDTKCVGVDLDVRLPGCECRYPQDCMQVAIANAENRMLTAGANLPVADTVLPFARTLQSRAVGAWISPVHGQYLASRLVGRDEDAPLACPLGAVNIYTIQDLDADIAYNNGILPQILNQAVRVLFAPDTPVDLIGSSPAELVQGTQAMPLYRHAKDFLQLATRAEVHPLAPLKSAQVGDTLRFGFEACLYDCDAIYASTFPPFVFGSRLMIHHFSADRATIEDAVAGLAAEAAMASGVQLRWVGRTVGDFNLELVNGSVVQAFNALPADGTLIYQLDPGVDPVADVLTLPALSAFVAATTSDAIVLVE